MKSEKANQIILGDATKELKKIPDGSIDLCLTDPPYGYSFMGKDWDKSVVSVDIWKECFRVLKDGAFAFVMAAPRQDVLSQTVIRLRDAGFNISFTSIYWTYASGFPKALNISKAVDKHKGAVHKGVVPKNVGTKGNIFKLKRFYEHTEPVTAEAKALTGSFGGFQPKPAIEIIIVVMKPMSEKTFAEQALKNGKAITWLDDCRIPIKKGDEPHGGYGDEVIGFGPFDNKAGAKWKKSPTAYLGRFPANILVSDDILNEGKTTSSSKSKQSDNNNSFSRYFDLDAWAVEKGIKDTFPFLICPKPSPAERNKGCEELRRNFHPTVKPIKLMSYLVTLGSRPDDVVLDPFSGSGTTCIAAKILNRNYIGIEKEKEYYEIAKKRLKAVSKIAWEKK